MDAGQDTGSSTNQSFFLSFADVNLRMKMSHQEWIEPSSFLRGCSHQLKNPE